jgi:hypothetical protein
MEATGDEEIADFEVNAAQKGFGDYPTMGFH